MDMSVSERLLSRLRSAMALVFPSLSARIESLPSAIPDRMVEYGFVLRELESGKRLLDVGCTSPYNIIPIVLADQSWEVHGIDVREFRIHHPNFKFHLGDVRRTGFPDSYFDCVLAVSTVEHIGLRGRYSAAGDLEGDRTAILEIQRILRSGGNLLLTLPFGKPKIVGASHRIYDGKSLRMLVDGLTLMKGEFYVKGDDGYWLLCEEREAEKVEAPPAPDYAIACLKLLKP